MYKGELPGLEWDEKKRRYFAYSKKADEPNLTPSSSGARSSSLQAGQVPTASPVIKSLKHSNRGRVFTCGVCLDEKRKRVQLPCNHLFCPPCLKNWLERKGHCPTCRRVVDVALHTAEMAARTEFNPINSSSGFSSFNAEAALQNRGNRLNIMSDPDAYFYPSGLHVEYEEDMSLQHVPRITNLVTADYCSGTSDSSDEDTGLRTGNDSGRLDTGRSDMPVIQIKQRRQKKSSAQALR